MWQVLFSRRYSPESLAARSSARFREDQIRLMGVTPADSISYSRKKFYRTFSIQENVCYRCFRGGRIAALGRGKTLEISRREIRFTTESTLQMNQKVHLAIEWPAKLDGHCLLQLELDGWVVASGPVFTVATIERYEFRTRR